MHLIFFFFLIEVPSSDLDFKWIFFKYFYGPSLFLIFFFKDQSFFLESSAVALDIFRTKSEFFTFFKDLLTSWTLLDFSRIAYKIQSLSEGSLSVC